MKRKATTLLLFMLIRAVMAQVEVNTNIRLTGGENEQKVEGLAPPTSNTAAMTVSGSLLGSAHWAEAASEGSLLNLTQTVQAEEYRPGMLLRFKIPADMHGDVMLRINGLPPLPLVRTDGDPPVQRQLREGVVAEVVHAIDKWVLLGPVEKGCPAGSLQIHSGLCMDAAPSGMTYVYDAIDACFARGGKLCTFDEYYLGCSQLGEALTGMFQQWEWIDDTSNHAHTGDQAGRTTCRSQRSANPVLTQGRGRCCYHIR